MITFTSSVLVSGFPPADQVSATEVDRWIGVAHEMDFLSQVLAFSCSHISVQDSIFTDT